MAFVLQRQTGTIVSAFTVREARGQKDRPAELRHHDAIGDVIWFQADDGWRVFVAGEVAADRAWAAGGGK